MEIGLFDESGPSTLRQYKVVGLMIGAMSINKTDNLAEQKASPDRAEGWNSVE
jgi:hypothetical protein